MVDVLKRSQSGALRSREGFVNAKGKIGAGECAADSTHIELMLAMKWSNPFSPSAVVDFVLYLAPT